MRLEKALLIILQLGLTGVISGQTTFSRTYNDTNNLASGSSRPLEISGFKYMFASTGFGLSVENGSYIRILSVNGDGDKIQDNFVFNAARRYSSFPSLIKSTDNNLLLAACRGLIDNDFARQVYIQKLPENLRDTIWTYSHSDSLKWDVPRRMLELPDGSIAVCGTRDSSNSPVNSLDIFLLKVDKDGRFQFFKTYDLGGFDAANNFELTADKGYLLAGNSSIPGNPNVGTVIKVDSAGNQVWVKHYPQLTSAYISKYNDNKYILSGYLISAQRPKLLLIDSTGNVLKNNTFNSNRTDGYIARKVSDGGIVMVGITAIPNSSDELGYVAKADSKGALIWQRTINHGPGTDYFIDFIETSDNGLLISGAADDGWEGGGQNAWLVKLDAMGCLEPDCWVGLEEVEEDQLGIKLFPNPATDWLNFQLPAGHKGVSLEVFSVSGKVVLKIELNAPLEAIQGSHLPAGLYLVKFTDGEGKTSTQRLVIAR